MHRAVDRMSVLINILTGIQCAKGEPYMLAYYYVRDADGGEWVVDMETQRAVRVISGILRASSGNKENKEEASPSETCPYHKGVKLICLHDRELGLIFDVEHFLYCPD